MKKRYCIQWSEEVSYNSSTWIVAESEEEALKKWKNGEWEESERDEISNRFGRGSEEICDIQDLEEE
jgi:hypothetical protein